MSANNGVYAECVIMLSIYCQYLCRVCDYVVYLGVGVFYQRRLCKVCDYVVYLGVSVYTECVIMLSYLGVSIYTECVIMLSIYVSASANNSVYAECVNMLSI